MASKQENKGKQGFASMDPEKQHEIASKGGRTAHKGEPPEDKSSDQSQSDKSQSKAKQADAETDHDESEELDELLDILGEGELTDLDPDEATSMIEEWQEILAESGDAGLKEIGKSLKQLQKTLSASKSKPADIAAALSKLGEQTDEYANDAGRGYKTKLHKLGKALNKAGKSLEEE